MTPITGGANRKRAVAEPTDLLAKRRVHDIGAAWRSDWTRGSNRGTRETTGSVRRSIEAVTEGLEGKAPGPHLIHSRVSLAVCAVYDNSRTTTKRPWTLPQPWTHRTRPPLLGNLAAEREIPTSVHSPFLFLQKRRTKNTYDDDCRD
jgi:hypothetical protein